MPAERDDTDYYALLGVAKDASSASIKLAFKRLALRCHPDVYHGADAEEQMRQLLLAYRTLSDPAKRRAYNARLAGHSLPQDDWQQSSPAQSASGNQPPGDVSRYARRDRARAYAFPDLSADTPVRMNLGGAIYDLSQREARTLQQQGILRGIAPEATEMLPPNTRAATPHYCHRCHHRWIPAETASRQARLWELICPACKANDWGEYLLLRCIHCCAVFESEQIHDHLGLAGGKFFQPYELFPLCPFCGTARWCPAEDARLETLRRGAARRTDSSRRRS